jgi:hypothetical protein
MSQLPDVTVISLRSAPKTPTKQSRPPSAKRNYPKERDGATHHWKAVIDQVEAYDGNEVKKDRKLKQQVAEDLSKSLIDQVSIRNKSIYEHRLQEKEVELKIINQGLTKYNKEEADRREYKTKMKSL